MNDVLNVNNPRLRIPRKQYTLSAAALRSSEVLRETCETRSPDRQSQLI